MSSAAAAEATPAPKGKKKLFIIIGAVVALVLVGGGVGVMMMSKKKAAAEEEHAEPAQKAPPKVAAKPFDPKAAPVFVPLDPFTVNLADRDAERFVQVGVTLEFTDPKISEQVKAFMPAIRNNVLLAIADRTSADLAGREGKDRLARRIGNETARAMGYDVEDDEDDLAPTESNGEAATAKKKKKKKRVSDSPVRAVHFSNFIIQ
jgi:flagellar protein FliL